MPHPSETQTKTIGDALAEVARGYGPKNLEEYQAACAGVARDQRDNAARYRRAADAYKPGTYMHDLSLRMAKSAEESAEEFQSLADGVTPPRFEGTYFSVEAVAAEGK
jgi:hypothetical protein